MKSKGIKRDITTPYTPQQNGAVERLNRTLVEAIRWWGEASALAAWIRNRVPTKVLPGTILFESWSGTKPNLSLLRTFGCLCYYHVPDPLRHKLQPKARAAIFLGIASNERAWRVWDLDEKRVVTSWDVVFHEGFLTKEKPTHQVSFILPAREEVEESEVPPQVEKEAEDGGEENNTESVDDVVEVSPTEAATTSTPSSLPLALTRERREVRPHPKYTDYATVAVGELVKEGAAFCFATKAPSATGQGRLGLACASCQPHGPSFPRVLPCYRACTVTFLPLPSHGMACYQVLARILQGTEVVKNVNKNNAAHAILFEALALAMHMDAEREVMAHCVGLLGKFLGVREPNIRYLALENMARMLMVADVQDDIRGFQSQIVHSLKDPDISIRRRALDLLYGLCDTDNAKFIVEQLLQYLTVADFVMREELTLKTAILAEKFAVDLPW
ncbi:unnamed protein product [Closterium sp. NIES-54]